MRKLGFAIVVRWQPHAIDAFAVDGGVPTELASIARPTNATPPGIVVT